jgi:ElaB/YqjD/DUF883 family membrane-anchored ribosome-binding protein
MKTTGHHTAHKARGFAAGNRVAHKAVDRMAEVADEAALRARSGIDRLAERAHVAVDRAASAAAPTATWLNSRASDLKANQEKLLDDARRTVSANPLTAVGIALAAGYLIARVMRR